MVASSRGEDPSSARVPQNLESKKLVKARSKQGKKQKPTVIHADASSFRNLVQQLTRSETGGVAAAFQPHPRKGKTKSDDIPAPPPATPPEPELAGKSHVHTPELEGDEKNPPEGVEPEVIAKSRIQTLAPPPLRATVIETKIVEPSPSNGIARPAPVRPTNPLSLSVSCLSSLFTRGPGAPSPTLGTFFSPLAGLFTSRHAVASPAMYPLWPGSDNQGGAQSDEESPGAVAFREALTVMLPPGSPKDPSEVTSELSPVGKEEEGTVRDADGAAMQIEAV